MKQSDAQEKIAYLGLALIGVGVLFCILCGIHFAVEYLVKRGCM
jgi:hypothetical protein